MKLTSRKTQKDDGGSTTHVRFLAVLFFEYQKTEETVQMSSLQWAAIRYNFVHER